MQCPLDKHRIDDDEWDGDDEYNESLKMTLVRQIDRAVEKEHLLHEVESWIHCKNYQRLQHAPTTTSAAATCWLPLRIGDELRYSIVEPIPFGRHHLLYLGDGLAASFLIFTRREFALPKARLTIQQLDTELMANLPPTDVYAHPKRRKKRTLWIERPDRIVTNRERVGRLQRCLSVVGTYKYNFVTFNCQHGCSWIVNGNGAMKSECIRRALFMLPVVFSVLLFFALLICSLYNRHSGKHSTGALH